MKSINNSLKLALDSIIITSIYKTSSNIASILLINKITSKTYILKNHPHSHVHKGSLIKLYHHHHHHHQLKLNNNINMMITPIICIRKSL